MLIKRLRGWEIKESQVTPEAAFLNRRQALLGAAGIGLSAAGIGLGAAGIGLAGLLPSQGHAQVSGMAGDLYPAKRNAAFEAGRPLTEEKVATTYNNFYEFGTTKRISDTAQSLNLKPWEVKIDGLVEKPITLDAEELIRKLPLEERIYRFRCVEAWAMTVPWSGFPVKALVDLAKPTNAAKYLRMETFMRPKEARGQRQDWYPWPYVEGLTMAEASNDLAFIATGVYGKPIPKQMGAPLRLAVPWKYGFKSVKSIVRFTFTDKQPKSFWEELGPEEYGFWANVNPAVPHPRWSQATEEIIGSGNRIPTVIYNGYGEHVAELYKGMEGQGRKLFM